VGYFLLIYALVICFPGWASGWLLTPVVGWGQPGRGARGRAVIAQLPWASGSRGIPPAAGPFLATHATPPDLRRGEQLGEDGYGRDGAAANSRPPGSAEPKHSSAFQHQVQLDDSPVARGATVSGAGFAS